MVETAEQTKARKAGYSRAWYARNKEQHNAAVKRWVVANEDQAKAYQREWAKKNKDRINEREREHYKNDPEHKERIKSRKRSAYQKNRNAILEANKQYRDERRQWLRDQLVERGCRDCGMKDWRCLEFHHRDPETKSFHVQGSWSLSRQVLATEIEKCDVLCANCHRIHHRTHGVEG